MPLIVLCADKDFLFENLDMHSGFKVIPIRNNHFSIYFFVHTLKMLLHESSKLMIS